MTKKNGKDMEDQVLEALLSRASRIESSQGAADRLMVRVASSTVQQAVGATVVPLRKPKPRSWLGLAGVGLPLAASLLLGIFIGGESVFDQYLPESVAALVTDDGLSVDLPPGLDDSDGANGDLA